MPSIVGKNGNLFTGQNKNILKIRKNTPKVKFFEKCEKV